MKENSIFFVVIYYYHYIDGAPNAFLLQSRKSKNFNMNVDFFKTMSII